MLLPQSAGLRRYLLSVSSTPWALFELPLAIYMHRCREQSLDRDHSARRLTGVINSIPQKLDEVIEMRFFSCQRVRHTLL